MNPISDKLKARLSAQYPHLQGHLKDKKDFKLMKCVTCKRYDKGPDLPTVGVIEWCVSEVEMGTLYRNIELMNECPIEVAAKEAAKMAAQKKNAYKRCKKSSYGYKRRW